MPQPIRGRGGHLVFLIGPKNTNLVKDIEILLSVKFVEFCSAAGAAILFFRSARKTQTR